MARIREHLLKIFYVPLIIFLFALVGGVAAGFVMTPGVEVPQVIRTDGIFQSRELQAYFNHQPIAVPQDRNIAYDYSPSTVLSAETGTGEKRVDVNLTTQTLTAFEPSGSVFMQVPISSGLWASTPTGTFRIWIKLRYTTMRGGSQAAGTYYNLPNVPCTQYFYKGYGLHGTYWHNNFGHPMSHGCVNMYTPDACKLFEWTSPSVRSDQNTVKPTANEAGTPVIIHY